MPVTDSAAVDLRAAALEAELLDARRELAELRSRDALKTQFLSNISHDLRTPLTAIITHGEILREGILGPLTERQLESVTGVIQGGRQLLQMVTEILTYAKASANRLKLSVSELSLPEVIAQAVQVHESLIAKRELTLTTHIAEQIPVMRADREKFVHVLHNLLGNAIDFTPPRGRIWVHVHYREDHGRPAHIIEVGDTGIGIAPEHFDLIFEEFAQVDTSASRHHHGTGLGLPIARRLVELHGGRIWLESTVGVGTQFFFTIPDVHGSTPSTLSNSGINANANSNIASPSIAG